MWLRVNPCCAGYEKDFGLLIPLSDKFWLMKAEDSGDNFLAGAFSVSPPRGYEQRQRMAWGAEADEDKGNRSLIIGASISDAFVGQDFILSRQVENLSYDGY